MYAAQITYLNFTQKHCCFCGEPGFTAIHHRKPEQIMSPTATAGRGWGEFEGRILSLNLECIQDSVVNATIFAQNALGLQTTTYLYDRWNCLLPPLLFSQPVGYSAFLCYSSPESQAWFRAAPSKGSHLDSSGYFSGSCSQMVWEELLPC